MVLNSIIITNHWKKFNTLLRVNEVNLGTDWSKYGMTFKSNGKYLYRCAFSIEGYFPQFDCLVLPETEYAIFTHTGSIRNISNTINQIYNDAIPNMNILINTNRELLHFEKYDSRFNWNTEDSKVELYLPLSVSQGVI